MTRMNSSFDVEIERYKEKEMKSMDENALRLAYDIANELESAVRRKLTFDQFNAILGKVKEAEFDGFLSGSMLCLKIFEKTQ